MKYLFEFKEYDNKNGRGENIQCDGDVLDIINKYAPWFDISKSHIITRGMKYRGDYYIIDPKKHSRVSANSLNYYTELIDNSKNWINYPKRSESLICSSNYLLSKKYSRHIDKKLYVVIPILENAKIGLCPKFDFWVSFKKLDELNISNLNEFNSMLYKYANLEEFDSYETIVKKLKSVDVNKIYDSNSTIYEHAKHYNNFYEFIESLLNPVNNGFETVNYNNNTELSSFNEVWLDSKCLLIEYSKLEKYLKK